MIAYLNIFGFIIIGGCIGWLMAMSESPLIAIIFNSLLIILMALFSITTGKKKINETDSSGSQQSSLEGDFYNINLWPFAFLLIGLTISGTIGLKLKNSAWFLREDDDSIVKRGTELLAYEKNYAYERYLIALSKNQSVKDSLNLAIYEDSILNLNKNNAIKFYISKSIFEKRNNISIKLIDDLIEFPNFKTKRQCYQNSQIASKAENNISEKTADAFYPNTQSVVLNTNERVLFKSGQVKTELKLLCDEVDTNIMKENAINSDNNAIHFLGTRMSGEELRTIFCELHKMTNK